MNFLQNSEKILGREEWLRQMGGDDHFVNEVWELVVGSTVK
jgi:hypothetical protein